ncbi:hypothetical protein BCR42DRAFT_416739 [Absidia repens]|uniref:ARID domain-containing protein n=1 Tax=Absidia repens TaxID=90262 RepID=A0A1X2IF89_9FUNG|nr:hypothetical protein BCR42DRAFT_416739 [Absidia repens]
MLTARNLWKICNDSTMKKDLYMIYNAVMAAGGYEQVSHKKAWKQIGEPFRFPNTCTNSAYVLKALYTRNLLGWEQEKHWKRHWTPSHEDVKGKGGSVSNTIVKPRDEARSTATALIQSNQGTSLSQRPSGTHGPLLGTPAHIDEEFRTRILLALRSTLPNEVDWVFNTLIRFSFSSENFCLDYMPTLVDHLIDFVEPFFNRYVRPDIHRDDGETDINNINDMDSMAHRLFSSRPDQENYERALQVFHILRNFSFLDNNIRLLAHHGTLRQHLMTGIALSPSSQYAELTRHCLDILENIAPQVTLLTPDDPYLVTMTSLLMSNDRALILGAIRSLTRVAVTEVNERVLRIPWMDVIQRLFQFLLVDDEELMAATLEYFYQYTGLRGGDGAFGTELIKAYQGNLVGLLTGLLSYKSSVVPASQSVNNTIHGISAAQLFASQNAKLQQSNIPDLADYMDLDEPYRCLGWLKDKMMTGSDTDTMALKDEFSTVLMIALPQPPDVQKAAAGPAPLIDLVLRKIKYSPDKQDIALKCHWVGCDKVIDETEDMLTHVATAHVPAEDQSTVPYDCRWKTCTRTQLPRRTNMISHLRTHLDTPPASKYNKRKRTIPKFVVDKLLVDQVEVSGVPLTAALILRDLAGNKQHHSYFMPYESELASLALQRPKLSKYILTVLSAL